MCVLNELITLTFRDIIKTKKGGGNMLVVNKNLNPKEIRGKKYRSPAFSMSAIFSVPFLVVAIGLSSTIPPERRSRGTDCTSCNYLDGVTCCFIVWITKSILYFGKREVILFQFKGYPPEK